MSIVLDYIESNNLNLVSWLDANPDYITINGSSFTWLNRQGNASGDYVQNTLNSHPVVSTLGVSFSNNQSLMSRGNQTLNTKAYTVISLSIPIGTEQVILSVKHLNQLNSSVNLLRYFLNNELLFNEYQQSYLQVIHEFNEVLQEELNIVGVVHHVKRGVLSLKKEDNSFTVIRALDTHHRLVGGKIVLGSGILDNLYHFLLFNDALTEYQIRDIIDLLISSTPVLNPSPYWDIITTELWDNLNTALWDNIL